MDKKLKDFTSLSPIFFYQHEKSFNSTWYTYPNLPNSVEFIGFVEFLDGAPKHMSSLSDAYSSFTGDLI